MKRGFALASDVEDVEQELKQLREAFITAMAWIAQSSVGVLGVNDAEQLIAMAQPKKTNEIAKKTPDQPSTVEEK